MEACRAASSPPRGCDDGCAYFNSKWEVKEPLARRAQAGADERTWGSAGLVDDVIAVDTTGESAHTPEPSAP